MAGLKEIKRRLASVKNTRQITRAMKLVSAAKLNKAQAAVTESRVYSQALAGMLGDLLSAQDVSTVNHPLMETRGEVNSVRLIVIGGNRGLCGAFNTNINKLIDSLMKEYGDRTLESVVVGKKPAEHYRRKGYSYVSSYEYISEDPNTWPIEEICAGVDKDYSEKKIDKVILVYTRFLSRMTQRASSEELVPFTLDPGESADERKGGNLIIFEPSAEAVFSSLIPRLMRVKVRQACLESKTSEHASRMTAMDSATKNAGELIDKLQLTHNRLRQSGITAELLDIVGGAEALN